MGQRALAGVETGESVRIAEVRIDDDAAAWLGAVGLHPGETVIVLRRAIFGGPIHLRTGAGGEFAVARDLAAKIHVESDP